MSDFSWVRNFKNPPNFIQYFYLKLLQNFLYEINGSWNLSGLRKREAN